jgi:hypothetical protein
MQAQVFRCFWHAAAQGAKWIALPITCLKFVSCQQFLLNQQPAKKFVLALGMRSPYR